MPSKLPNLPPLAGIQDPAVRAYLEAFSHIWLVRNGQSRDSDEKFVSVSDLKSGLLQAMTGQKATRDSGPVAEVFLDLIKHVKP